jgi:hypothetical protein
MKFSAPIVFKAQMYFSVRDAGLTVVSTKYIRQAMPGSVYRHSFLVGVQFPLPRFIKLEINSWIGVRYLMPSACNITNSA